MISLFLGAGAGAWVYSKMMHRTGNNTQSALIVAGFAALGAFVVMMLIFKALPSN